MSYRGFYDKLNTAKKEIETRVVQGLANDFEDYKFYIGQIRGLQIAIDIYEDLIKRGLNDEIQ